MEQRRFEFVLQAAQPIAHHAETFGNQAIIARRKVRQPDGGWAHVPIVSGDAMRHGLREAAAYVFLDAAGLLHDGGLSASALRLMFAGGQVTGSAGGVIKLSSYREMVDLMPALALLGGCAQNRVIPGRLWVDDAVLICQEQEHMLPEWALDVARRDGAVLDSSRAHVEEAQRVRMDPLLDPGKRTHLTAGEAERVDQRLLASENASELGDAKTKDETKSTMMPRSFERVAQGSLFYWALVANCYSALDVDTFHVACAAFLADARVGGKRGTGHGLLRPVVGRNVQLARPVERAEILEPDQLSSARVGQLFRAHVQERAGKIAEFLREVAA
jgi:hypothetical protein